jgi:hypothetical protein
MGKLRSGILGQIRGKVAGVVGGQWKDVNYVREYVKPANPDTAAQQVQRALFSSCVAFCKPLVGPVFNAYTDIFYKGMSGFNAFIKSNIDLFTPTPTYASILVTEGKLYLGPVTVTDVSDSANTVTFTWSTSTGSNGASSDKIFAVAYNQDVGLWGMASSEDVRSNGATGGQIAVSSSAGQTVRVWVFAIKKSGTQVLMVSNSGTDSGVSA